MSVAQDNVEELKRRIVLSDVVKGYVTLTLKGQEYQGLCPFHKEKTPSFTVNDQKNFYHCFGCGAHGDAFNFVQKVEGISFPDTLQKLADFYNIELKQDSKFTPEAKDKVKRLYELVELTCQWYENNLRSAEGKDALSYLQKRQLSDQSIHHFRLGYSPNSSQSPLYKILKEKGFTDNELAKAGVLLPSKHSTGFYDRLRGRVIFPITDRRNRVVAFGGRSLDGSHPKYLNSAETSLFHKRENLYAFSLSLKDQKKIDNFVVVEGYMDVIAIRNAGIPDAVAPLGTALTEQQIFLLWKYCDSPILCFDGDNAGLRAAARAAYSFLPHLEPGKSAQFIFLPDGEDPDSYIKLYGTSAFTSQIENSQKLHDVLWRILTSTLSIKNPDDISLLEKKIKETTKQIKNETVQNQYRYYYQQKLKSLTWKTYRDKKNLKTDAQHKVRSLNSVNLISLRYEQALLASLIQHPDVIETYIENLTCFSLSDNRLEALKLYIIDQTLELGVENADIKDKIANSKYSDLLDIVFSQAVQLFAPFSRSGCPKDEVEVGIQQILDFMAKKELNTDEKNAISLLSSEFNEDNYERLLELKKEKNTY